MKIASILVFSVVILVSACANHTAGISVDSAGQVRVDNSSFARNVSVTDISSRLIADVLQGSALISSKVSSDLRLQYKFTWYDASGFTVEDEASSWKSIKLHGKQQLQVSAVAPNAQVSRFDIYVRETFSN